ncbi:glycoside hydrolase family 19 protein [Deinococcus radiopugnans]|uniref:Chitinase n=1 Tax=Deinococcus radiopugnans ATCC 19172 TaxID=585398 RepID=A0ABR6NS00_9DEIO|nr:glycoside hydrolase family 19 protein [Deinococcus radiopugnans]MBB6016820.1 putative chitinase [Deinococcus radiopugnans ATCC 19172]
MITPELVRALGPRLSPERAEELAAPLAAAAKTAEIDTRLRVAAFMAQAAHETAGFRYLTEVWGPTAQQLRYDPASGSSLSRTLGNLQRGDGFTFRGRGIFMLTGRHNYRLYGELLRLPLEAQPDLAARPDVAATTATTYWTQRALTAFADVGNFREITRRINGGYTGWPDRLRLYNLALSLLPETPPRVLLVDLAGNTVEWSGRPDRFGDIVLSPALIAQLRIVYASPGGPWSYPGLRVWVRRSGDMVLERAPT